jgi:hypothetical protein
MTKRMDKVKLYKLFSDEVCTHGKTVDPDDNQDWYSLSIGWAIAKGYSPAQAHTFSLYARYDRHYKVI